MSEYVGLLMALMCAALSAWNFATFAATGGGFSLAVGIFTGFCAIVNLAIWVSSS